MSRPDFLPYAAVSMPECELRTWVIEASVGANCPVALNPGERLFWNNEDGWGCASTATRFTESEKLNLCLPTGGFWQKARLERRRK